MNDFLNPYIAGAPVVEPSMFFGRQDVFDWIEQNLSGRFVSHILVIHGQRRVGKTSVLKQIPNHLPPHFINVFLDLQGRTHTSLDRFQWWLAREICRAVNQASGQSIPVPDRELFTQDGEFLVAAFMPEVLSNLGESVLLLTFDEFDTLSEPEIQASLTRPLITYLRRLFDLPSLTFIFSIGSSGHKLENMQASYTEFFKTALYRKISFLKQEDCASLITRPVEGVLRYEIGAVQRIYEITSGHPYFTQLICHELFSLSQKTGRRTIVKEDVDAVLEDVIERGTVNLKFVWDEANDLEKWVLSSLAHELHRQEIDSLAAGVSHRPACNEKQLASALHNLRVRFSENDLNTALVHLREKDVLTQENRFVVELLCIWLLKNRPLDRVREELVQVNPIANRYNEIGDEFRELGQPDKAMDSYKQALTTDPSNLRAQVSIANLHLEGKNYPQAVAGFEAALRLDDDDVAARSGLCTALLALGEQATASGKPDEAMGFYQRILTANPDHPEAHLRLSGLYAQRAEDALAAEDAELALRNYAQALEHAPDDDQLARQYALAKEKHTQRLIDELKIQSEQALAIRDWNTSQEALQRALQLAPGDPALLARLEVVKDAPRLAQIIDLNTHAAEMQRLERWDEVVQDWEACLQLKPANEAEVRQSLEHARQMQLIAQNYSQAQAAIKAGRYSHAITLLQGVIARDASYKDAAELLVTCLKVRPKHQLKLPARWWLWPVIGLVLVVVIGGLASQWSRITSLLAPLALEKTPVSTQVSLVDRPTDIPANLPPPTQTAGTQVNPTAASEGSKSFAAMVDKLVDGRPPDVQDDFLGASLQEYWQWPQQTNTLQDSALRVNNWVGTPLQLMNYILQVDLRFNDISGEEKFVFALRSNTISSDLTTEYTFIIYPKSGDWYLLGNIDAETQGNRIMEGKLGPIDQGRWYELGVVLQNATLWVFWDDAEILNLENMVLFTPDSHFGLADNADGEALLEIDNWQSWNLGTVTWMRNDWIHASLPTYAVDGFSQNQGWQISPVENGKFENGRAILFADTGMTSLTSEYIQASNLALEVNFIVSAFPDPDSLVWTIGKNIDGDCLQFEYFPVFGKWRILKVGADGEEELSAGMTKPTGKDTEGTIMLLVDANRVSVFLGDTFLGYAESDRSQAGTMNALSIRSNASLYTQVDFLNISFWNLDAPEMMIPERIYLLTPKLGVSNHQPGTGWRIDPEEHAKYQDGMPVLYTDGDDTYLNHPYFASINSALELVFIPREMPDTASLMWQMGKNDGSWLGFEYSPITGNWRIFSQEKPQDEIIEQNLASGTAAPVPQDSTGVIMLVADSNHVGAFLNGSILGSVDFDRSRAGTNNNLAIKSMNSDIARVDIVQMNFWDLGTPEWMRSDWVTARVPKFVDDRFQANEGWEFLPVENEKYQDGKLVLSTSGGETALTRQEFSADNFAMEVTFMPREAPDEAYLMVFQQGGTGDQFAFEYSPGTGYWSLFRSENQIMSKVLTAQATSTPVNMLGKIMLVVNRNRISAFNGTTFLGSITRAQPATGAQIYLSIRNIVGSSGQVDIAKIRFWNLDEPEWMSSYWITSRPQTFSVDTFKSEEGWQFGPPENAKFQDDQLILYTNGGETELTRNEIKGTNTALYVAFIPRAIPDDAALVWFMRENSVAGSLFSFEYVLTTGAWGIFKIENNVAEKLLSGNIQAASLNNPMDIMVVIEGNRVSAFQGTTFLGSVESGLENAGYMNWLVLRSPPNTYAQVDLLKFIYWSLDR